MYCEICEKPLVVGKKVEVEGSVVVVCDDCTSYGKVVSSVDIKESAKKTKPRRPKEPVPEKFDIEEDIVLVRNYHDLIKDAREKLKLKQEELAKLINEPASLIRRIESGKAEPSPSVGRKICRKLDIQLYKKREELGEKVPYTVGKELTLGDVVIVRKSRK